MQIIISSDVAQGANIGQVAQTLEQQLNDFQLPEGYSFDLGGRNCDDRGADHDWWHNHARCGAYHFRQ